MRGEKKREGSERWKEGKEGGGRGSVTERKSETEREREIEGTK